jgi:hypothetical protein
MLRRFFGDTFAEPAVRRPEHRRSGRAGAFMVIAALLVARAAPALAEQVGSDAASWRLIAPVDWVNNDHRGVENGSVVIDEVSADSTGGRVRVTLTGVGPDGACPGHAQHFQLTWRFASDVASIGGHVGDPAVSTVVKLSGDQDACLRANPFWKIEEDGVMLASLPGGQDAHNFTDPPSPLAAGSTILSVRNLSRTRDGFHVSFSADWPSPFDIQVRYIYLALPAGAGAAAGPVPQLTPVYAETGPSERGETRGPIGRFKAEAATIHHLQCNMGDAAGHSVLVYEYINRTGFEAVEPSVFGSVLGGRDFPTFDAAANAACGSRR